MIVLSFITRNSKTKLSRAPITLSHVLNSTLQLPYRSIILVDNSSDGTAEAFREWCRANGRELTLIRGGSNRAVARQSAIDAFLERYSDRWLMFVDDDVVLNEGWWDEARRYAEEDEVGLIWGVNYDGFKDRLLWLKALKVDYLSYLVREFYHRGGLHDTMLRREAVEDIRIPLDLHIFEDWYILRHILSKGYKTRIVWRGIVHYNPWASYPTSDIKLMSRLAYKYKIEDGGVLRLLKCVAGLPLSLYVGVRGFGLRGLPRGVNRWRAKVIYRLLLLINRWKVNGAAK